MKNAALFAIVASAAVASAQVTVLPNGTYQCAKPGASYCASGSLGSPIIIRCDANSIGQPGNCNDNVSGEPPLGVGGALCWETSATSGDAACEKNCVIYAATTSTVASCVPSFTASSSSTAATTTSKANSTSTSSQKSTTIATVTLTTGTGGGHGSGNGTLSTSTVSASNSAGGGSGGNGGNGGSATNTPPAPTSTTGVITVPTAGAATNGVSVVALLGLAAAYLL